MAEARKKYPTRTTPAGVAKYPKLNKPDTKFKEEGEYSVTLLLSEDKAQAVVEAIHEAHQEAKEEGRKKAKGKKVKEADLPFFEVVDDQGNETGEIGFKFKTKASGTRKDGSRWTRRPALFDSMGQAVNPAQVEIWGGSILKVAYTAEPFYVPALGAGVTLRLQAVQVLKLVSGGQREAKDYGFGEEEGYAFAGSISESEEGDEGLAPAASSEQHEESSEENGDF